MENHADKKTVKNIIFLTIRQKRKNISTSTKKTKDWGRLLKSGKQLK